MNPSPSKGGLAMNSFLKRLLRDDDGPTSVEYAVLLAGIIVVCISTITFFGGSAANMWTGNRQELENAFTGS
jgi:pilus assembly protein Flp/PilA